MRSSRGSGKTGSRTQKAYNHLIFLPIVCEYGLKIPGERKGVENIGWVVV